MQFKTTFFLFFLLLLPLGLYAYIDDDMDGVEDKDDSCLYTPFMDIVDNKGCSIESLLPSYHFDLIAGVSYSETDYNTLSKVDTITTTLQLNYYYKKIILSLSSSYYNNYGDDYRASGMNDTYLGLEYILFDEELYMSLGGGVVLPTYEDYFGSNKTDYRVNLNLGYTMQNINLFTTFGHSFINDEDVINELYYQDSNYFSLGAGYFFSHKLYTSLSYSESDSIYRDIEKIRTASLYGFYSLNSRSFLNLTYAHGLSDSASDNYLSLSIGYKF